MPNGPDSWDELHQWRRQAEGQGLPASGSGSRTTTTRAPPGGRSCGRYGGSEVAKDGKTITYNSKESPRGARSSCKALYKDAMTPEVLAWDDASNNRLPGLRARVVDPQPDQRRTGQIEGQNKELADKIFISALAEAGRPRSAPIANCRGLRHHQVLEEPGRGQGLPGEPSPTTSMRRSGVAPATTRRSCKDLREGPAADHQRGPEAQAPREVAGLSLHDRLPRAVHAGRGRGLPAVRHGRRARPVLHRQARPSRPPASGREDQGGVREVRVVARQCGGRGLATGRGRPGPVGRLPAGSSLLIAFPIAVRLLSCASAQSSGPATERCELELVATGDFASAGAARPRRAHAHRAWARAARRRHNPRRPNRGRTPAG